MHSHDEPESLSLDLKDVLAEISQLEEHIPVFINEESDILGPDPKILQMSLPLNPKERNCLSYPILTPPKRSKIQVTTQTTTYTSVHRHSLRSSPFLSDGEEMEEIGEEEAVWDTKAECMGHFDDEGNFLLRQEQQETSEPLGRFDDSGNFVMDQSQSESSTSEDWIVVEKSKTKKKRQSHPPAEAQSYTAVQNMPKPAPRSTSQRSIPVSDSLSDTDSEGFTVVKDKKSKSARFKK
ncbi:hypothetical protein NEHOM01_1587 [Nematocida homosporus]|uniref:uncharacterized protein n=1 Tax=Nematocida homosporus TaxID=1912981 RepID=UPI00221F0F42|nr:uncharacterized protein NEHOM01_1587 [Nematocida homosporus]KAI5186619.1 hypothetical protein NEHOM01_1587 [Nematocida homosporus]